MNGVSGLVSGSGCRGPGILNLAGFGWSVVVVGVRLWSLGVPRCGHECHLFRKGGPIRGPRAVRTLGVGVKVPGPMRPFLGTNRTKPGVGTGTLTPGRGQRRSSARVRGGWCGGCWGGSCGRRARRGAATSDTCGGSGCYVEAPRDAHEDEADQEQTRRKADGERRVDTGGGQAAASGGGAGSAAVRPAAAATI